VCVRKITVTSVRMSFQFGAINEPFRSVACLFLNVQGANVYSSKVVYV